MKLATFVTPLGNSAIGAVVDDSIVDLAATHRLLHGEPPSALADMQSLIEAGAPAVALAADLARAAPAEATAQLATVTLLAPLPRPAQIRDFLAFEEHVKNSAARLEAFTGWRHEIPRVWYEQPVYYKANRFSVVGPDAEVRWPRYADLLDFELELACILGTRGLDISREEAASHIFGFTIFNDVSARDTQAREMVAQLGPAKGKDFDTGNVLGPWIVTPDELGDPYDLTMVARVNGEEWGRGNSGTIHYRFEDMIAFVSQSETLYPGEVFGSGTVGTGCGLEQGRFLRPGDVVELEIERIGVLRNRVVRDANVGTGGPAAPRTDP